MPNPLGRRRVSVPMRTLLIALILSLAAAAPAAAAENKIINVGDDYFVRAGDPPTVKVRKGRVVEWKWVGSRRHNVAVVTGPKKFQSDLKSSGNFIRKLKHVGLYEIVCSIHQPDMTMKLRVKPR